MPVARRVVGGGHDLTLRMKTIYASALFLADDVTLDDLRPVARAPRCRAPALFLRATGDALLGAQLCGNQPVRRVHPKILH